jgi:glutamine amidotransferase
VNVALFDYGAGNLHSLKKALEAGGARVTVTASWTEALARDAVVLPGVGSFGAAVRALDGEQERVREALEAGFPILGICLGMHLLFQESEEGEGRGIGLIPGRVRVLRARVVPQMGWNDLATSEDPLFQGVESPVVYYANSYVCAPEDPSAVIAVTEYQGDSFAAAVRRGRSWGLQFHPEKSSSPGLRMIRNFLGEVRGNPPGGGESGRASSDVSRSHAPGDGR